MITTFVGEDTSGEGSRFQLATEGDRFIRRALIGVTLHRLCPTFAGEHAGYLIVYDKHITNGTVGQIEPVQDSGVFAKQADVWHK